MTLLLERKRGSSTMPPRREATSVNAAITDTKPKSRLGFRLDLLPTAERASFVHHQTTLVASLHSTSYHEETPPWRPERGR
jgi:hypothetical protein